MPEKILAARRTDKIGHFFGVILTTCLRLSVRYPSVTLTCHVLEPFAVKHNDPAPTSLNETRLFELASHECHLRPPDPEHLREELLGQREDITLNPIPGLEKPTGQTRFHGVKGNVLEMREATANLESWRYGKGSRALERSCCLRIPTYSSQTRRG